MKYNYLSYDRATDTGIQKGIKSFQQFFHLPVSGVLDKATEDLMKKPRCGNSDLVQSRHFVRGTELSHLLTRSPASPLRRCENPRSTARLMCV